MKAQRLRLRYRLSAPANDLRPRDLADAWAASVSAAGLVISMSEGKRPVPQVALAATLPQGATSDCELIDVFLAEPVSPVEVVCRIASHLPPGVEVLSASEMGVYAPSLQSQLRWAEYQVDVSADPSIDAKSAVERLLSAKTLPTEYVREKKTRAYDLRPLILDLRIEDRTPLPGGQALSLTGGGEGDTVRLRMRLRAEQDNTGRADQVLLALDLPPATRIHRTRLEVEETPAVLRAYRRGGERVVY